MNKIIEIFHKIVDVFHKVARFMPGGKTGAYIKSAVFVAAAFFIGTWLGLKLFFPDDYILSKINEVLFVKDMGLTADSVSVSPFGNISLYDGTITKKGDDIISFGKLGFSPSLFDLFSGEISGAVSLHDVNNQGGSMKFSFDSSKTPCYSFDLDELPVAIFNAMLTDMSFTGTASGDGRICVSENQRYTGKMQITGDSVVLRGKVPTQMGPLDIGSIMLGKIDLSAKVNENKADIEKFIMKGLIDFDIIGKITLNSRMMLSSRMDLDVRAKVSDSKKLAENSTLNLLISQMSPYKTDKENDFAFMIRGFLSKPQLSKAPKERTTGKSSVERRDNSSRKSERNRPKNPRKRPEPNRNLPQDMINQEKNRSFPANKMEDIKTPQEMDENKPESKGEPGPGERPERHARPEKQRRSERDEADSHNNSPLPEEQSVEEDNSSNVNPEPESESGNEPEKDKNHEENDSESENGDNEEE